MGYDFAEAVDAGGHDRLARGHRLQQDDAEALVAGRRRAEDVAAGVVARQLAGRYVAGHHDIIELLAGEEIAVPAPQRAIANDDEPQVRVLRLELGEGAQQVAEAFAVL